MSTGPSPDPRMQQLVAEAHRVKVVLGHSICIGELMMWKDSEPLCFLYENEFGQRTVDSFPDMQRFVQWLERTVQQGHNVYLG